MIIIKLLRPRAGLKPRSARRVATYLGLGLAIAMNNVGKVEELKACIWRRHPDVAHVGRCRQIDLTLAKHLDETHDTVRKIVDELDKPELLHFPRGLTISLKAQLGRAELGVDIDVYSDEEVPKALSITNEPAAVIAEPRGYVDEKSIESFYELTAYDTALRELTKEFYRQIAVTYVKIATYIGVRQLPLEDLTAWVKASKNYGLELTNAIPLLYNPWIRQLARDLYALAPTEFKRLAGPIGLRKAAEGAGPQLAAFLKTHYEIDLRRRLMLLYPRRSSTPAETHEKAVKALAEALRKSFTYASRDAARRLLESGAALEWRAYIEALTEALKNSLTSEK
ncbi:hypothetical protein [Pyrobaculum sp.]|uniref:hypothetical protein n=1 Tax=Pyrobaculum sp. TaxID=2004705 RepID=UPI00317EB22E